MGSQKEANMLNDLKIDELLKKVDSRYGLVLAGARRAREINEYTATLGLNDALGIPGPQVHTRSQHPLTIAIEELREGKLRIGFKRPLETAEEDAGTAAGGDFVTPPSGASQAADEPAPDETADSTGGEDQGAA